MADPEQIYQEVLSEEQGKGSASVVAEARAKAARQRATEGSPHPKEPKWWPGAQPQFEGGDGAAPAEAEPEQTEEASAEEAPAEEAAPAPAAEEPAPAAAAPAETVAEPPELTRDQPEAPTPAAQPAAATAPVAPAATATAPAPEAPAPQRPSGVTHGTPAGNRLRPEDAVATEPQFEAQAALHQRRKMIDELVSTGVPAVSARSTERRGGGVGMLLLYLLIPLIAVGFLVSNQSELAAGGGEGGEQTEGGGGEGGGLTISAANVQFDKEELTIPADGASLTFINDDTLEHNVAIYEEENAQTDIFVGEIIPGGQEITYEIPGHEPGEYYFQCDVHPAMNGTAIFE